MNILFLNPIGRVGGAERVLVDVIASLRTVGSVDQITVILLSEGPLAARLRQYQCDVIVEPLPGSFAEMGDSQFIHKNRWYANVLLLGKMSTGALKLVMYLARLRKLIKQHAPELVYSNGLKTHLISVFVRPRNASLVWHLHDFYGTRPAVARMIGLAAKQVDRAIAISEAVKQDTQRLAPKLKISVIYNAVDQILFAPSDEPVDGAILDQLSHLDAAPAGVIRFGLIATYANWKGHHVFLDALLLARDKVSSPVRGYIIGGPIYSTAGSQVTVTELGTRIKELGLEHEVGLIPFQDEPSAIYRMLDIVVHASTRPEPFGLAIAEAMSCGRALIVSAAGGAQELFDEGVHAIGHTPGDSSMLAEAMIRLGNDPDLRSRLAINAAAASRHRFSHERFANQLIRVFQELRH